MSRFSRRTFLGALLAAAASARATAHAHSNAGVVTPPLAAPALSLTLDDGAAMPLARLLAGKVTAVQLMFTSCRATCPIQGAVFAQAAKDLGDKLPMAQWLSISIDPAHDDPKTLHDWMARFGAHPRWRAARPDARQLDPFVEFLKARTQGPDRHTAQVYFFDRKGRLAMRSVDFPPAAELLRVLEALAAQK